jgi:hypothetical protein
MDTAPLPAKMGDYSWCPFRIVSFLPIFSKAQTKTEMQIHRVNNYCWTNRCTQTHQLLKELNSTITTLAKCTCKRRLQRSSWGSEVTIQSEQFFCSFWVNKSCLRGNGRHLWNPGVISYALILKPQPKSSFFASSIVHGIATSPGWTHLYSVVRGRRKKFQ